MKISPALRERFIITADDYGVRQTAVPILRLAREGKVDRVAVLARFVTPEDAKRLLETNVKIDIHLDLIAFLKRGDVPGDATLLRGLSFILSYLVGDLSQKAVEDEWNAQVEKFRALFGRLPDGMNSHEHVHYFPSLFRVFLKLGEKYNIPYLRFGRSEMLLHLHRSFIARILAFFAKRDLPFFRKKNFDTSDYLVSYDWLDHFMNFTEELPAEGKIELIVHPERKKEFVFADETF